MRAAHVDIPRPYAKLGLVPSHGGIKIAHHYGDLVNCSIAGEGCGISSFTCKLRFETPDAGDAVKVAVIAIEAVEILVADACGCQTVGEVEIRVSPQIESRQDSRLVIDLKTWIDEEWP